MKEFKFWRLFIVFAVCIMAIAGCGKQADTVQEDKPLQVVTTTTMITDLVQKIGGDHVSVQGLMGPGVDPHLYQASAGDVTTMSKADVVVYNGIHLEGKMGSIFDNLTKQNKATIRVSDAIDPATLLDFDEEDGVKTKDPHIWFDVANWKLAAKAVYEGLAKADPAHKEDFKKRYDAYLTKLDETDAYVKTQAESIPKESRVLVTAHDAFQYFARAYGFEVKGLQGVSTATEAGTQDVNELVQFIVDHKIKAIFVESSVPHKTIEAVQEAAKAKGVNSLPDLLKATGVPLEPFIDDKNRAAQEALHKEPEPEQMSFF